MSGHYEEAQRLLQKDRESPYTTGRERAQIHATLALVEAVELLGRKISPGYGINMGVQ